MAGNIKFIVDNNVGKLTRWLRMMGYDTLFFDGEDDWQMVRIALDEGRVMLTRDTQIMKRGVVATGRLKSILIQS
ncbi:Mut7-C RNAse domain-containing protein, partial [Chloroflexota bacterium]